VSRPIVVRMKQGHHPSGHLYGLIVNGTIAFAWIERVGGGKWKVAIGPEEQCKVDLIRTTSSEQTPRAVAEEAAETFRKAMLGEGVEAPVREPDETMPF
jgi:hypothetical protein